MKPSDLALWGIGAFVVLLLMTNGSKDSKRHAPPPPAASTWQAPPAPTLLPEQVPSPVYYPPTFHGRVCTQDCSGHEAGYAWAENEGITDPLDCTGNSNSFIEGCEAYAQERQAELETEE